MPNVYTHESVAAQFTEIADRLEQFAHRPLRPLASREGFIAAQQAGMLLGVVIEQGLIEVPVAVKEAYAHLKGTPVAAHRPSLAAAWLHPSVRFFHLAIDRWLGGALPGMVRLEPGGLSRFDNTQRDDEEDQDLWAGRLRTMAGACRVLADLLTHRETTARDIPTPADNKGRRTIDLDIDDVAILSVLAETNILLSQPDIEVQARISRKTVGQRLDAMRNLGLTHRPKGKRGGETITESGRQALARHGSQITR